VAALCRAYQALGFDHVLDGDEVLRHLVLARIIEPTSKADAVRVLAETGIESTSYRTVKRRLPEIAKPAVRQASSAACAAHASLGPASLVLYDVSTLYFETDTGDGFREPGAADHPRATHRRDRVPADGASIRGQHGRDRHHAAGHHRLQDRPPADRRDRRRRLPQGRSARRLCPSLR